MRRIRLSIAAIAAAAAAHVLVAAPGRAQAPAAPAGAAPPLKIVPDCGPRVTEDIVVCGRRGERSPYRLPPQREGFDPDGPTMSVARERHRLYEVGDTGIGSCSDVGPGGWTGCQFRAWKEDHQQRDGNAPVVSFGLRKSDPPKR
jgi:hypothetical protein